jgi:MoaA/NifB/PqqE/SkfB family radical SAM enzyme
MYDELEHYKKRGIVNEFGDVTASVPIIKNVGWTLGNFCPNNCKHCYSLSARMSGTDMTTQIIDRVIEQLIKNNIETVNLGGNEPIYTNGTDIHDSLLMYIVEKLNDMNIKVGITTSGITLLYLYKHRKDIFSLVNDFDISLDSPFKDEHNENRRGALYNSAIECLEICQKENKAHGVIMAGMNWNFTYRHLQALVELCKKYGSNIRINVIKPLNKTQYGTILTPQQFYDGFNYLMTLCDSIDIGEPLLRGLTTTHHTGRCPCGVTSFRIHSITPDRKIYISPCVYLHDYKSSLDLLSNDLSDIINSPEFIVFRQRNAHPELIKVVWVVIC